MNASIFRHFFYFICIV
ncbi:hypothetical protein [Leuconostoc mesenteroides]